MITTKTARDVVDFWLGETNEALAMLDESFDAEGTKAGRALACSHLTQLGVMMSNYFTDLASSLCGLTGGNLDTELLLECRASNVQFVEYLNRGIQSIGREVPEPVNLERPAGSLN